VFGFRRPTRDRCGREFEGEGSYLPSRRLVFCSQKCAMEYTDELLRKGELRFDVNGPVYDCGGCG